MDREEKNKRIREKGKATRERHANMLCRCYEVKVDSSKMSKKQKNDVSALFREAKWLHNAYLADMENVSWKDTSVTVKAGERFEQRDLTVIGSQIRQSVINEVKSSLKSLASLKGSWRWRTCRTGRQGDVRRSLHREGRWHRDHQNRYPGQTREAWGGS